MQKYIVGVMLKKGLVYIEVVACVMVFFFGGGKYYIGRMRGTA